ncbi:MAG: hypothetical protein JWO86_7571 [Myxococcaceae bacterium]|jgi:hypothetical protein|nr:hypothetical protein [Myxococcaceae bacterium]
MFHGLRACVLSRRRTVATALFVAAAVAGCGGLVQSSSNGTVDGAPPGVDGVPPNAEPGRPGAGQPSVPVPKPPNPVQRCSFKEGPWLIDGNGVFVKLMVRMQSAQPILYVSVNGRLGRYTVASADPCVLERDPGFEPSFARATLTDVAVDDDGTVWASATDQLQRAFPLPVLKCTIGPGYIDNFVGNLLLDDDGKGGWGLEGPEGKLGRLTLGANACSVDLADPPWGPLPVRSTTPRDTQGRLHVVDAPAPGSIGIYTGTGTLVKSYSGKSVPTDPAPLDATRCSGGVCVVTSPDSAGQQSIVYLDEDGNPRAPAVPLFNGLRASTIGAARSGAVFVAGDSDPAREAIHQVVIQMAPAPP